MLNLDLDEIIRRARCTCITLALGSWPIDFLKKRMHDVGRQLDKEQTSGPMEL